MSLLIDALKKAEETKNRLAMQKATSSITRDATLMSTLHLDEISTTPANKKTTTKASAPVTPTGTPPIKDELAERIAKIESQFSEINDDTARSSDTPITDTRTVDNKTKTEQHHANQRQDTLYTPPSIAEFSGPLSLQEEDKPSPVKKMRTPVKPELSDSSFGISGIDHLKNDNSVPVFTAPNALHNEIDVADLYRAKNIDDTTTIGKNFAALGAVAGCFIIGFFAWRWYSFSQPPAWQTAARTPAAITGAELAQTSPQIQQLTDSNHLLAQLSTNPNDKAVNTPSPATIDDSKTKRSAPSTRPEALSSPPPAAKNLFALGDTTATNNLSAEPSTPDNTSQHTRPATQATSSLSPVSREIEPRADKAVTDKPAVAVDAVPTLRASTPPPKKSKPTPNQTTIKTTAKKQIRQRAAKRVGSRRQTTKNKSKRRAQRNIASTPYSTTASTTSKRTRSHNILVNYLNTGRDALALGDLASAQLAFEKALALDAKHRDGLIGLATVAQHQGNTAQAIRYYEMVLTLNAQDSLAIANLASLGKIKPGLQNESRLKDFADHGDHPAQYHFALGNFYARENRWPEAQQAYFSAYARSPNNPDYIYNLAVSLDHLRQYRLAQRYYQEALDKARNKTSVFDLTLAQNRLDLLSAGSPQL